MNFDLQLDTETVDHTRPVMPLQVAPDTTARAVFRLLRDQRRGCTVVCKEGVLVGIFTERDAVKCMVSGANLDVPIERLMTKQPATLMQGDTVAAAIQKMSRGGFRRLPIVDDRKCPVGLMKVSTILHFLVQHFPRMIYNLPPHANATTHAREGA